MKSATMSETFNYLGYSKISVQYKEIAREKVQAFKLTECLERVAILSAARIKCLTYSNIFN